MEHTKQEKEILNEVILGYRRLIEERYQYEELRKKYKLPESFNEDRIALFRAYFLNYLYPHPDKRKELNEAFESLDNYIKLPKKLLLILIDSSRLIFKYGRHLPKILGAGIKTLRSFRSAIEFENSLVRIAISNNVNAPFDKAGIFTLIKSLSRQELEEFIENSHFLFETLHDRSLVAKIIEIVEHLIKMMKKHPRVYSPVEIRGLEIGYEIIRKGNQLFDQLNKKDQEKVFSLTIQIEREILDQIFED